MCDLGYLRPVLSERRLYFSKFVETILVTPKNNVSQNDYYIARKAVSRRYVSQVPRWNRGTTALGPTGHAYMLWVTTVFTQFDIHYSDVTWSLRLLRSLDSGHWTVCSIPCLGCLQIQQTCVLLLRCDAFHNPSPTFDTPHKGPVMRKAFLSRNYHVKVYWGL